MRMQRATPIWNSKADKIASRTLYAIMHAEPALHTKLMRSPCKSYAISRTLNAMTCKYHVVHTELMLSLICSQNQYHERFAETTFDLATFEPGGARATCTLATSRAARRALQSTRARARVQLIARVSRAPSAPRRSRSRSLYLAAYACFWWLQLLNTSIVYIDNAIVVVTSQLLSHSRESPQSPSPPSHSSRST